MTFWTLARKEFILLLRDRLAAVLLLVLPFLCILVLGLLLGEGFWQKPDERLRVSVVNLDRGFADPGVAQEAAPPTPDVVAAEVASLTTVTPAVGAPPAAVGASAAALAGGHVRPVSWAELVVKDLRETAGIRIETIPGEEEARRLCESRQRSAVIVFGPDFSARVSRASFLNEGINPFYRDGVDLKLLDVEVVKDETQLAAASIIDQVAQMTLLRVIMPYMSGRAFETMGGAPFVARLGDEVSIPNPKVFQVLVTNGTVLLNDPRVELALNFYPNLRSRQQAMKEPMRLVAHVFAPDLLPAQLLGVGFAAPAGGVGAGPGGPAARLALTAAAGSSEALALRRERIKWGELIELAGDNDPATVHYIRTQIGEGVQRGLQKEFAKYNLTGKTWASLTRSDPRRPEATSFGPPLLAATRYQILVPSFTVMFGYTLILMVGWLFVAERTQGTLKRLRAATSSTQILLGKAVPCLALALAQALLLLALGRFIGLRWGPPDWPVGRQLLWLAPVVLATSLSVAGLSLFVAVLARTPTQVTVIGALVVIGGALIGGCLVPRTLFTEDMLLASLATPQGWALRAYNELLLANEPNLAIVAQSCAVLSLFGVGLMGLSWLIMPRD